MIIYFKNTLHIYAGACNIFYKILITVQAYNDQVISVIFNISVKSLSGKNNK